MSELLLYTAQAPVVTEALERDGVSRVKKAYVDQKYGETAWVFQTAYVALCGQPLVLHGAGIPAAVLPHSRRAGPGL